MCVGGGGRSERDIERDRERERAGERRVGKEIVTAREREMERNRGRGV